MVDGEASSERGSLATVDADQRSTRRIEKFHSRDLKVGICQGYLSVFNGLYSGRGSARVLPVIDAKLVDVSKGGLGIETRVPLALDAFVTISSEFHSAGLCFELLAEAQVIHCTAIEEDGGYRCGLVFERVSASQLECDHGPEVSSEALDMR